MFISFILYKWPSSASAACNPHSCDLPSVATMISYERPLMFVVRRSQSGTSSKSRIIAPPAPAPIANDAAVDSSEDSLGASAQESKAKYDTIISEHPDTILALNHETIVTTSQEVIPYAIQKLKAAGYSLVTLAECLGQEPYQWVSTPQVKDVSTPSSLSPPWSSYCCNRRAGHVKRSQSPLAARTLSPAPFALTFYTLRTLIYRTLAIPDILSDAHSL